MFRYFWNIFFFRPNLFGYCFVLRGNSLFVVKNGKKGFSSSFVFSQFRVYFWPRRLCNDEKKVALANVVHSEYLFLHFFAQILVFLLKLLEYVDRLTTKQLFEIVSTLRC